jgi:hypothetical protein
MLKPLADLEPPVLARDEVACVVEQIRNHIDA